MAPGRADVSQDSERCRADSEPAGTSRPDDVKLMYMYWREGRGKVWARKSGGGKSVTLDAHKSICTVSDRTRIDT